MLSLTAISKDPYIGKKLKGEHTGFYSIRVWPYRIVYRIYEPGRSVIITRVGHRQGIY